MFDFYNCLDIGIMRYYNCFGYDVDWMFVWLVFGVFVECVLKYCFGNV